MGSVDKACISGFLCRLCSEMHRTVIHIYGDQGKRLSLVEKINGYLPITISPTDPLPKTICTSCLRRVEQHYDLLLRLSRIKEGRFLRMYKGPDNRDGSDTSNLDEDDYLTEEQIRRNNPNGPFIIASTSLSAAANVSRSSPTTLSTVVHQNNQSSAIIQAEAEVDAEAEVEDEEEEEVDEEEGEIYDDDDDDDDDDDEDDEEEVDEEDDDDEDDEDVIDEVDEADGDESDLDMIIEDDDDEAEEDPYDGSAEDLYEELLIQQARQEEEDEDERNRNSEHDDMPTAALGCNNVETIPRQATNIEEQEVIEDGIIDMERVEEEIIND